MKHSLKAVSRVARAGFTLIELLAVITIIAILSTALVVQVPKFIDNANVTACRANMQELYKNFLLYKDRFKDWPNESGIRFFLRLWKVDTEEHNDTFARRFSCPGVPESLLPGLGGRKPRDWFPDADWSSIDSTFTAYAGRDMSRYPNLDRNPGSQALVSDDNELAMSEDDNARPNHRYKTLALMGDGSVQEFDVFTLREEGVLHGKQYPVAGPDCPVKDLQTLSHDALDKKKK